MKNLNKYLAIFAISLKNSLNYRGELLLWGVIDGMPLVGNLILWSVAFAGTDTIAGFTQSTMISYYLIGYLFANVTGSHFEDHYVKEILSGNINAVLFKPYSIKKALIVEEMSWRIFGTIITSAPIVILGLVIGAKLIIIPSLVNFLMLLITLPLAYLIDAIFSLAIVAMGFVFEEARSLMHLKWMLSWLFSGSMIPFELLPNWLADIARSLPFQTRYYLPTAMYTNSLPTNELARSLVVSLVWAAFLYGAIKFLWNHNMKKFSAVGS